MTGFDTPQHCNGDGLGDGKPVIVDGQCAGATRVAGVLPELDAAIADAGLTAPDRARSTASAGGAGSGATWSFRGRPIQHPSPGTEILSRHSRSKKDEGSVVRDRADAQGDHQAPPTRGDGGRVAADLVAQPSLGHLCLPRRCRAVPRCRSGVGFRLTGCAGGPGMRYLPGAAMRQAGL